MRSENIQRRITWCFTTKGGDTHGRVCHAKKGWHTKRKYTHSIYVYIYIYIYIDRREVHILCCRMWIKHEINVPLQKLVWWQKNKNVKKNIIQSSSPTTMQTRRENFQICATQERILADRVYAIIMYQSMLKECVVKVVNKSENENYSQDHLCLERTRSNTPKYLGSCKLRRLVQFLGSRDQNCRCGTLTQQHQRVAIDTSALTQLEMTISGEPELRIKTPHNGIIESQKESMPRETEKH